MKFLKLFIIPLCILCTYTSCGDDDDQFSFGDAGAEFGAVPRLINLISDEFDLDNISTAAYSHEVEFVTQDDGTDVETYEIVVEYIDNTISNGDNSKTGEVYMNIGQDDFGNASSGNRNIIINIGFLEVTTLLGIEPVTVEPGDEFRFKSSLILSDGRVFNTENSQSFIQTFADAYFDWTVRIICPVEENLFTGLYTITYEGGGNPLIGPAYNTGDVVEVTAPNGVTSIRQFSAVLLPELGSFSPVVSSFELLCNKAVFVGVDTGVDCNGEETDNSINFAPAFDINGIPLSETLDLSDDSEIILFINEGAQPGNCTLNNTQSQLTLTKM